MRHIYIDDDGDLVCETEIQIQNTWTLEEKMNLRSSFNCLVNDVNGATIGVGKEIKIYNDSTYLWGGVIEQEQDQDRDKTTLWHSIKVQDYSRICSRVLVKKAYDNMSIDEIVKDFISRYFASYGITEGTIETGLVTLNVISFNYIDGESSLNELCTYGNYVWEIDKDKKLNFYTIGYVTNSTAMTDSTSFTNMKRERSISNYFNKVYIKGDKKITVYRENKTPTPPPNGTSKTFIVKYPVAKAPKVEYRLAGGPWLVATVGILGIDEGKQFYFTYNSPNIVQDDDMTELNTASGDNIRISYYGLVPLFVVLNDTLEIASRGIYEAYIKNLLLSDTQDALTYGRNLLSKYSEVADNITFDLYTKTYEAGEQFYLSNTKRNITSELFFIDSITWKSRGPEGITYSYKVLDGASLGGWENYFYNLLRPEKIKLSDNEIIIILKNSREDYAWDGTYSITILDALYPSETLYPTTSLYPGTITDTDSITD